MKLTSFFPASLFTVLACHYAISAHAETRSDALLFHLSCDHGLNAEVHGGKGSPNFAASISEIGDGAVGKAFRCGEGQLLAYSAPGNIYAQRGTLSFWWRSGIELTETEFPIFRVSYADHSSWDMVWLRIDYNGHGFDAFVTDVGLERVRVSYQIPEGVDAQHWYHLALTWDESHGICFYVDGKLVGEERDHVVLNAGLDQMGPHSRIISPYQVQTAYNCIRGGDIDELRVYSQPLTAAQVNELSQGMSPDTYNIYNKELVAEAAEAWNHYYGFDADLPLTAGQNITVRKVAIHDAYDLKRWYWKGCDGIRETTWPGVYNRSRLRGRFDYIQLPDWDCYSLSGQQVTFTLADEPWNHIEVSGSAHGSLTLGDGQQLEKFDKKNANKSGKKNANNIASNLVGQRQSGVYHSVHRLDAPQQGGKLTFSNNMQEMPIQELDAYYVHEGDAPEGLVRLSYSLAPFRNYNNPVLQEVEQYVAGRYQPNERQMLIAVPADGKTNSNAANGNATDTKEAEALPLYHIVIPNDMRNIDINMPIVLDDKTPDTGDTGLAFTARSTPYSWRYMQAGLDGILLQFPEFCDVKLNIQVKDPIWTLRNMMDVTLQLNAGEEHNLWLDLRDRILPNDKPLYITIALSQGGELAAQWMRQSHIQLVFKDYDEAKQEHVADRMVQIIDNHGMIVEEATSTRRMSKYVQIERDMEDLLRVEPSHDLARKYWYCYNPEQVKPVYTPQPLASGVPRWAGLQLQLLTKYRDLVEWYIDNRQIENGEFGGGLSDDTDLGNVFPGLIHSGAIADKATQSLALMLEAIYDQGLLQGGISTLMTDGLHTYEEGTNTIVQVNVAKPGDPRQVERMMEASRTERDWVLGHNRDGHLHFRSDYFSATRMAERGLWTWSTPRQFLHLAPALMMGQQYGNADARKYIIEFAETMLAHSRRQPDGHIDMPVEVNYETDSVRRWGTWFSTMVLDYCYRWTHDRRYLEPLLDASYHLQLTQPIDTATMAERYETVLRQMDWRDFIMKQGSVWIDRIYFSVEDLERSRLGGIALTRSCHFVPSNPVYWRFADDSEAEQVAIFIPENREDGFDAIFYNTADHPVTLQMVGNIITRGKYRISAQGSSHGIAQLIQEGTFGQDHRIGLTIPSGIEYTVHVELIEADTRDNTQFCDLAISDHDVILKGRRLKVSVHNLGAVASTPCTMAVVDIQGREVLRQAIPAIAAPQDLQPSIISLSAVLPRGVNTDGLRIILDADHALDELFESNNAASVPQL